ncbi:class I SAM-dependent methyltransferase [Lignipirellula cremea]|uniref:class I SAM-dependent methyltransferase n=1 Tax=Lignipirellula cremea TaxID=2528010 RepID=UPI003703D60E
MKGPRADHSTSSEHFEQAYRGHPPWDIGKPQPAFVAAADAITGSVLDVGCGTGENALFFAARGQQVVGVDFLEGPLQVARRKAAERGIPAEFVQHDARRIDQLDRTFDNVLDSGLFHGLSDADRQQYVSALANVLEPQGKLFLECFSDREPAGVGPRRITQAELEAVFAEGWHILSLTPTHFVVREDTQAMFSPGGPHAWFCTIQRVSDPAP